MSWRVDRIQVISALLVLCFASVLLLSSQSAASYSSYFLALSMILTVRHWNDVLALRGFWLVCCLLGWLSLSSFWSDPFLWREAVSTFSRALLVLFFVVAVAECQLRGLLRRWLARTLALAGLIAVVAAIYNFVAEPPVDGRLNGLGLLDTHVIAALVYSVVLIFMLDLALSGSYGTWRVLGIVSGILVAVAIALSDSRNAWVSACVGAGILIMAHRVRDPLRFLAAVMALALAMGVGLAAMIVSEESRDLVLPRGLSFRPEIWSRTIEVLFEQGIWLGAGINTSDNTIIDGIEFLHPHSMYISVLYQGGVPALLGLLAVIAWALWNLVQRYQEPDAKLGLGILGVSLPAYFLDGHELVDKVGPTWFLFWFPVALALGFVWGQPGRRR